MIINIFYKIYLQQKMFPLLKNCTCFFYENENCYNTFCSRHLIFCLNVENKGRAFFILFSPRRTQIRMIYQRYQLLLEALLLLSYLSSVLSSWFCTNGKENSVHKCKSLVIKIEVRPVPIPGLTKDQNRRCIFCIVCCIKAG